MTERRVRVLDVDPNQVAWEAMGSAKPLLRSLRLQKRFRIMACGSGGGWRVKARETTEARPEGRAEGSYGWEKG